MTKTTSAAVNFTSQGIELVGVIQKPNNPPHRGVIVVVGGPQYRVGSHRQFVLLARTLAESGFAVMRFDHQGVGDSDGVITSYENIGPNITSAIDCFFRHMPELKDVTIWGLCDAASAAMIYGHSDARVTGLALLNPWVRNEASLAKTYMDSYYGDKLRSAKFWRYLLTGKVPVFRAFASFAKNLVTVVHSNRSERTNCSMAQIGEGRESTIDRMRNGLEKFSGRILLVLSGNDLTASEFSGLVSRDKRWAEILQRKGCTIREFPQANHTFSSRILREEVSASTKSWLNSW